MLKKITPIAVSSLLVLMALQALGVRDLRAQNAPRAPQAPASVTISSPADGSNAGREITVRGAAQLASGEFLWLLARRTDFEPLWWPQHVVKVDPKTHEWSANATIGSGSDVGSDFDVAVITVDAAGNQQLNEYWTNASTSGNWKPTRIPNTTSPPRAIRVHKTSDR